MLFAEYAHSHPASFLVQGGSLGSKVFKQMTMSAGHAYADLDAIHWCIDVANALEHLHSGAGRDLVGVHRDIKLENVLLSSAPKSRKKRQTAKLADFGLIKVCSSSYAFLCIAAVPDYLLWLLTSYLGKRAEYKAGAWRARTGRVQAA